MTNTNSVIGCSSFWNLELKVPPRETSNTDQWQDVVCMPGQVTWMAHHILLFYRLKSNEVMAWFCPCLLSGCGSLSVGYDCSGYQPMPTISGIGGTKWKWMDAWCAGGSNSFPTGSALLSADAHGQDKPAACTTVGWMVSLLSRQVTTTASLIKLQLLWET